VRRHRLPAALGRQARFSDRRTRRAARRLDYWHLVDVRSHANLDEALDDVAHTHALPRERVRAWLFSAKARLSYLDAGFALGDALVFGKESTGLPEQLLAANPERVVGIPTLGAVRSLNLANAVSIALYEALRYNRVLDSARLE
jgi:tRNA (cytidine/uridine-2'-O-)-methyltransferase